jgi:hypothetical protein
MTEQRHYGVIYSFDCPRTESVKTYLPRKSILKKMQMTEGDSSREYGYLEGEWENCKHRKYGAVLTQEEFDQFVDDCELRADSVETMGAMGMPGSERWWGCTPAIAFNGPDVAQAYVTPYPKVQLKNQPTETQEERWWKMLKKVIVNKYGGYR